MATNITPVEHSTTRSQRGQLLGVDSKFRGCTVWFTGLSGAGKTTLAFAVEAELIRRGVPCYGLDGDNCRTGLNKNLGFSDADRDENIRRVGEVAKLFADGGIVCLSSFISPTNAARNMAKEIHKKDNLPFFLCHVATPLDVCEKRDPKGLYKRARKGEIKGFTGIDSVYEEPKDADIVVGKNGESVEECCNQVLSALSRAGIIGDTKPPLVDLHVPESEKAAKMKEADGLYKLNIDKLNTEWLQVLAEGWASPLKGFMREKEFLACLHFNTIPGGASNMSVPIVLPCNTEEREQIKGKDAITLVYEGKNLAILRKPEVFDAIKEERCARTFGITGNNGHPYIERIYSYGDFLVGGEIECLDRIRWNDGLDEYRLTPTELRAKFKEMGSDAVYAFQLRNPVHNGHALLMQDCHQKLLDRGFKKPVLLLHPLGGTTKDDDVPLATRMAQHKACLTDGVLKPEHTVLAIWPSPMVYAGPTEVQWHCKSRVNGGADFYIVGRDPAGMGHPTEDKDLYLHHHGREVLQMAPGLKIEIIPFRVAAYRKSLQKMDFFVPEEASDFMFISGTKMRGFAREGVTPPDGFMCPTGWGIVSDYYQKSSTKQINEAIASQDLKKLKAAIKKLSNFDEAKLPEYLKKFTDGAKAAGGTLPLKEAVTIVCGPK